MLPVCTNESIFGSLKVKRVMLFGHNPEFTELAPNTPVTGWPRPTGYRVGSSAALGDIDQDGQLDVIIGGTNDPATPIRWAEEMVGELGPSAMLVTFTGEGHGQLLVSTCVTDIEATVYLHNDIRPLLYCRHVSVFVRICVPWVSL